MNRGARHADAVDASDVAMMLHVHLAHDLLLGHLVADGDVDADRAAQWLVEEFDWDVSPDTVASLLREYDPPPMPELQAARRLLQESAYTLRTGFAVLDVITLPEAVARLPFLLRSLPEVTSFSFVWLFKHGASLLTSGHHVDGVRALLGSDVVRPLHREVSKVSFVFPQKAEATELAKALVLRRFLHEDLEVLAVQTSEVEAHVFVPDLQAPAAFDLVLELTSGRTEDRAPPATARCVPSACS